MDTTDRDTRPRAWRLAAVAAVGLLIGAIAFAPDGDPSSQALADAVGQVAPGVTQPPPPPTTTTTKPPEPLPVPEQLPSNYYAATEAIAIGTLEMPTLGVVGEIQEGSTLTAINRGPSHWPGTALPGHLGNAVLAGHRTTYTKPFNRLEELQPGDPVLFHMRDGTTYTYEVRGVIIVPAASIGIAAQDETHTATLFGCHPKGKATHRIVAKLRLLNADGTPVDADEDLPPIDVGLRPGDDVLHVRDPAAPAPLFDPYAEYPPLTAPTTDTAAAPPTTLAPNTGAGGLPGDE